MRTRRSTGVVGGGCESGRNTTGTRARNGRAGQVFCYATGFFRMAADSGAPWDGRRAADAMFGGNGLAVWRRQAARRWDGEAGEVCRLALAG